MIFSSDSPEKFFPPVFLSTSCILFNFWKSSFSLNRITRSRQRKTLQIFVVLREKTTRNYLATNLIDKCRQSFFTSSPMNPVLLMFSSWNQPSRLTDQTELQRVDTNRVSNSSPEWKWKSLRSRSKAKAFEVSFPSLEFASQDLLTSVPIDYINSIAAKSTFWTFAKANPITEYENYL